ncbi:unnamed protein product [Gadus morhua 'NCC']
MTITPLFHQQDVFTENDDDSIASSFETPLPISTGDGDRRERETIPIWAKNINATLEVLLRKLETVEQNQREALLLLRANRHGDPGEASVELLQAQTQAELQELEEHLKNREFTKKCYSLRGKKGKMPLLGTAVGSTIKQAIMKWKPELEEKEVELMMAEVLKHAPSAHAKSLKDSTPSPPVETGLHPLSSRGDWTPPPPPLETGLHPLSSRGDRTPPPPPVETGLHPLSSRGDRTPPPLLPW